MLLCDLENVDGSKVAITLFYLDNKSAMPWETVSKTQNIPGISCVGTTIIGIALPLTEFQSAGSARNFNSLGLEPGKALVQDQSFW